MKLNITFVTEVLLLSTSFKEKNTQCHDDSDDDDDLYDHINRYKSRCTMCIGTVVLVLHTKGYKGGSISSGPKTIKLNCDQLININYVL